MPKKSTTSSAKTYRQLQADLEDIIAKLQDSSIDVDEAVGLYSAGQEIVEALQAKLTAAKNKIKKLTPK